MISLAQIPEGKDAVIACTQLQMESNRLGEVTSDTPREMSGVSFLPPPPYPPQGHAVGRGS